MKTFIHTCLLFSPLIIPHPSYAQPIIVNDRTLVINFEEKMEKIVKEQKGAKVGNLVKSLSKLPEVLKASDIINLPQSSPEDRQGSVFIIAPVFDCGHCDRMHIGGLATAWALTSDGLMVTNYHVFKNTKGERMGISDIEGNIWPVTKLIAASQEDDLCIFQVEGKGFKPLALANPAPVGSDVEVIGHPGKRFFTHTFGKVTRYFHSRSANAAKGLNDARWMSISADFAKGSSGGPVINKDGKIVGVVSYTNTLAASVAKNTKDSTQMVIKNCTPVLAIWEMVGRKPE